jgi:DNA primase
MLKSFQRPHFKVTTFVKQEKPQANIVDLYARLTGNQVKTNHGTVLVKCCFHEEDTPSLALYTATSSYYCFGCQKHGDLIQFVEEVEHCSFQEAIEIIRQYGR